MRANKEIIITIGPQGSGKSTWATKFIKDNNNFIKVERDDIRYSIRNIGFGDSKFENLVTEIQYSMIHNALNSKYNVIISDCNCNIKFLDILINEFKYKANISFKIFDTPLEQCIDRDAKRERKVGEDVIKRTYTNFKNLIEKHSLDPIEKFPEIVFPNHYDPLLTDCVIVDLDGTIAHANNKRHIYNFKEVGVDDLDFNMFKIIESISSNNVALIFLTARSEVCYDETLNWLREHNFPLMDYMLLMRKENDYRPSKVVKKELYETYIKGKLNVLCAFDDKSDVVEMWRENGIKALQVLEDK